MGKVKDKVEGKVEKRIQITPSNCEEKDTGGRCGVSLSSYFRL